MTGEKFFGFYWTLPVPRVGFTTLPRDAAAAAEISMTIRYQRDVVRRWVKDEAGFLIGEEAFIDLQPDRGTVGVTPEIERIITRCSAENATIVLVDFARVFGWRQHGPLWGRLHQPGVRVEALDPEPTFIKGQFFDPKEHFRIWRELEIGWHASKTARKQKLKQFIRQLREEGATLSEIADRLNGSELPTLTGRAWTAENVGKFLKGS